MLKIEFSMGNDYFLNTPVETAIETVESIIKLMKKGKLDGKVWDLNGNVIGHYSINIEY